MPAFKHLVVDVLQLASCYQYLSLCLNDSMMYFITNGHFRPLTTHANQQETTLSLLLETVLVTVLFFDPTGQRLLGGSLYSDFWEQHVLLSRFNKIYLSEKWTPCPKNTAVWHLVVLFTVCHHPLITDLICVFFRWIQLQLLECLICELLCFYFQGQNDAAEIRTGNFRFHW